MTTPFYVPPEQLMKDRAEYARKGIARGRAIIAVEYASGILLLGENPSGALQKISEIYDRIAFAGVGKFNEFEQLRVGGIRRADLTGYAYSRSDVTAKSLANAYAQTLGLIFTQEVKPYEVEVMVAELGDTDPENRIFKVTYDGTLSEERHFAAIGGSDDTLTQRLGELYSAGGTLEQAIGWAKDACSVDTEEPVGTGGWEAAVLDRGEGRRAFRRLEPEVVDSA